MTALAYDNRLVTPGTLFFCVPGFTRDGHDFADDAIARGAVALVVRAPAGDLGVPEVLVDDVRAAMAPAAAALARRPDGAADHGRHHRHQRQDDDGLPRARAAARPAGTRPACSAP